MFGVKYFFVPFFLAPTVASHSHSHSHSPTPTHSHSHSHLILDPGSAYYDDAGGGEAPSSVIGVGRCRIQDQVAVAVAVAVGATPKKFTYQTKF